jgi:hypothetical protein
MLFHHSVHAPEHCRDLWTSLCGAGTPPGKAVVLLPNWRIQCEFCTRSEFEHSKYGRAYEEGGDECVLVPRVLHR